MVITAGVMGSRRPRFADWSVPAPPRPHPGDGRLTLRELIGYVVRNEVGAFRDRQEARRLDRVLSTSQIAEDEAKGKIAPEGRGIRQEVAEEAAVEAALVAFEDGMYLVVIDGVEHRDLDAQVFLTDDSRVTFIRLVFLSGA